MYRKDLIDDFDDAKRQKLADLMKQFLTDSIVAEHVAVFDSSDVLHPNHKTFFRNHRTYISKLETFLINNGGEEFVPLPKWDDTKDIPNHFEEVRSKDDGTPRLGLNPAYNSHFPPPLFPLPDNVKAPSLCSFDNAENVTHQLAQWHGEVHARLGGVMFLLATATGPVDPVTQAAAALIFWPWHAFNDVIFYEWERCKFVGCKSICVEKNKDGRMEVFVIGNDNALWHCWQDNTYGFWSLWEKLDGTCKQIVVAKNKDGRLEVFHIGSDNALYHKWQVVPNGSWGSWNHLGGVSKEIAVGTNLDGRIEVFAVGSDDKLWHIYQTAPNNGWSSWESLGTDQTVKKITVGLNPSGYLEVIAIVGSNSVMSIRELHPSAGPWFGWTNVGFGQQFVQINVATDSGGILHMFGIDTNNKIWHNWRAAAAGWRTAWTEVSGITTAKKLAVTLNTEGKFEIFAIGIDTKLLHSSELSVGSNTWSSWQVLSNDSNNFNEIVATMHADGHLEVFGSVINDVIWHAWQFGGVWQPWQVF